jgi:NADPH:quinone reductase-like Zn-dependent oxidoreductase
VFTLLPILTGEGRAHHGEILREAANLVDADLLFPTLDEHRYTLETVAEAHDAIADRSARGKLVVDIIR